MTDLTLTDDEVVALAVAGESFWPGILPTVDITVADDLGAALLRGQRSLIARGLVDANGGHGLGMPPEVRSIPGRRDATSVVVADESLIRRPGAFMTTHYRMDNGWLVESVSPLGLHEFVDLTDEANSGYVASLAAALHGSVDPGMEQDRLCVARGNDEGCPVVVIGPSSARVGEIQSDGSIGGLGDQAGLVRALRSVLLDLKE